MREASDSLTRRVNKVGEITASRTLLTFRPEDKIEYIVREMNKRCQGAVGITEGDAGGKLLGLLTERDVLRTIFGTHEETQAQFDTRNQHLSVYPATLTARDVMTANPVCVTDDMPVDEALDKIRYHAFRYMPVIERLEGGKLVGIVSERELFWHAQEKLRRTIQTQSNLLSFFIKEPYGCGSETIDTLQ